jgi:hypothetical protein
MRRHVLLVDLVRKLQRLTEIRATVTGESPTTRLDLPAANPGSAIAGERLGRVDDRKIDPVDDDLVETVGGTEACTGAHTPSLAVSHIDR